MAPTSVAEEGGKAAAALAEAAAEAMADDLEAAKAGGAVVAAAAKDGAPDAAAASDLGISLDALVAPVAPPPRKKRKLQEEFTVQQKLDILSELEAGAASVPALAEKHKTSRTSIYRWKKDQDRLLTLRNKDGKGQSKRVSNKRKTYNEEYSAAEKLAVVRELKGKDAPSVKALAEKLGANHRSLYRWKATEAKLIQLVEEEGRGDAKRAGDDPLHRIKEGLKIFKADYDAKKAAGEAQLPDFTGTMLAEKAKQIRDDMLAQHANKPFLSGEEVNGMEKFKGSVSWGRKTIVKFGWKDAAAGPSGKTEEGGDGEAAMADAEVAVAEASKAVAHPKKGAKSAGKEEPKRAQNLTETEREIKSLKRKLAAAERENARLLKRLAGPLASDADAWRKLRLENESLKLRVASLTGTGGPSAAAAGGGKGGEQDGTANAANEEGDAFMGV